MSPLPTYGQPEKCKHALPPTNPTARPILSSARFRLPRDARAHLSPRLLPLKSAPTPVPASGPLPKLGCQWLPPFLERAQNGWPSVFPSGWSPRPQLIIAAPQGLADCLTPWTPASNQMGYPGAPHACVLEAWAVPDDVGSLGLVCTPISLPSAPRLCARVLSRFPSAWHPWCNQAIPFDPFCCVWCCVQCCLSQRQFEAPEACHVRPAHRPPSVWSSPHLASTATDLSAGHR